MCIIVDANVANDISNLTEDGKPVVQWALKGGGAIIIGGKLKKELYLTKIRTTLVILSQAGRLHNLDDEKVSELTEKIKKSKICCSDDPHVIAAILLSKCRLIFTRDKKLHKDAKNLKIVNPAASIYSSRTHKRLLTKCECV